MLRTKEVGINFVQGMDTKTDEILNQKLDLLQNCTLTKEGTPRKRDGFTSLVQDVFDAVDISTGEKIDSLLNELCMVDRNFHYTYAQNEALWVKNTPTKFSDIDIQAIITSQGTGTIQDVCYAKGDTYTLVTYTIATGTESGSYTVFIDNETGAIFKKIVNTYASYKRQRPVFFDGVYAVIAIISTGELRATAFTIVGNTINSATTALDTALDLNHFDVLIFGTTLCVAYFKATNDIYFRTFDSTFATLNSLVQSLGAETVNKLNVGLSYDSFNSLIWCGFSSTSGGNTLVKSIGLTDALVVSKALLTVANLGAFPTFQVHQVTPVARDAGNLVIFYEWTEAVGPSAFSSVSYGIIDIAINTVSTNVLLGKKLELASSAFVLDDIAFVIAKVSLVNALTADFEGRQINSSYVMISEATDDPKEGFDRYMVIAQWYTSRVIITGDLLISMLQRFDGQTFYSRLLTEYQKNGGAVFGKYQISKCDFTFSNIDSSKAIEAADRLMYPGASPKIYDGDRVFESQFHYGPVILDRAVLGGGSLSAGVYRWVMVFSFFDAKGIRIVSFPSAENSQAVNAADQANLTVESYSIGIMSAYCTIDLYRTVANGDTFFLESRTVNNSLVNTQVINSTISDVNLMLNETYPFPGEVLEAQFIPPYRSHVLFKNRMMVLDLDRPDTLSYSNEFDQSNQFVFNEFLRINIEDNNYSQNEISKCVGIIDDKVIIFKDSSIFFMIGDGPNNSGEQNNFSRPQIIATDVGCDNAKSICLTPLGLMFKSQKGIYLLTRGLEVKYVGADVEDYNDLEITSSLLLEDKNEVIFSTRTGQALVFDYLHGQWSIFENWSAQDSCFWKGQAVHLKDDGIVNVQNTTFDDNGDFIPQKIITGWIKMSDIQNFGRVRRFLLVGKFKSAHQMKVSASYDYEQFAWTEYTLTPLAASAYNITVKPSLSDLYAGGIDGVYQWELHLQKQKCMAVKFMIEDVETSAVGESYSLTNMTMELGIKSGPNKVQKEKKG